MTAPTANLPTHAAPIAGVAGAPPLSPMLAWLVDRAGIDDAARGLVIATNAPAWAPNANDPELLARVLLQAEQPMAALRVVASAIPPREGIWWAWVAVRHAAQTAQARADAAVQTPPAEGPPPRGPTAAQLAALAAVEGWIGDPSDDNRRAVWEIAQVAGLDTPAGSLGAAAFMTSGSVTPLGGPFVPPPAGIHVTLAATAVLLAALHTDAARVADIAGAFVTQGVEIVRRLGGWDASAGLAKQAFDRQVALHADASKPPQAPAPAAPAAPSPS